MYIIMYIANNDLASNGDRIIRHRVGWTGFKHFYAVFNYILQPTVRAAGVIAGKA